MDRKQEGELSGGSLYYKARSNTSDVFIVFIQGDVWAREMRTILYPQKPNTTWIVVTDKFNEYVSVDENS